MKKILIFLFLVFPNISLANTYIETKIDKYTFRVIEYDKSSEIYDIKIVKSETWSNLKELLTQNNAITWINWVFFCPKDYSYCNWENSTNNERYIAWEKFAIQNTTGNRVVFGWDREKNTFLFQTNKINKEKEKDIYYGFSNWPLLLQDGKPMTELYWDLGLIDEKMRVSATRNFVCSDKEDKKIYFWLVSNATIDELAVVLKQFGCYNAINLDAWASTAFINNWVYVSGPGRDILDAIVIKAKWIDTIKINQISKKIAKILLKNIPKNDTEKQIIFIDKNLELIKKYQNSFNEKFKQDYYVKNFVWEMDKSGYKIEINDKNSIKTIYTLNQIQNYLIQTKIFLQKFSNLSLENPLDLKIKVEIEW